MQNKNSIQAFSLVEMLMALLVASLLMAALAPVMTRRMNDIASINTNNISHSKGWRLYNYSPNCTKAEGNNNVCEFRDFKIPLGVYAVNLVMVSGGGGGAGATSSNFSDTITKTKTTMGYKTDTQMYDEQIIPITEYMTNVKISTLVGGGGSGGGAAGRVIDCAAGAAGKTDTTGNSNFITSDYNGLCITKYNQRTVNDCWTGYTTTTCDSSNKMNYTYSGCNRAVCTWNGAQNACSALSKSNDFPWRLPTSDELKKWDKPEVWKRIALCDMESNTNVSVCSGIGTTGSMIETGNSSAYPTPYRVWARTNDISGYLLIGNTWDSNTGNVSSYVASTRCVFANYTTLGASGGASGSILKNIDIQKYVKQAGENGQIVLRAGRGGKGGKGTTTANTSANNGEEGYRSCIYVQEKPTSGSYGNTIYALCAYGGAGGKAPASVDDAEPGAAIAAQTLCREYINGNWKDTACTTGANSSNAGTKVSGSSTESALGGSGADSPLTNSGKGEGGTAESVNGKNASSIAYGAGGGGGTSIYRYGDNATGGDGGNGAGGIAEITYNNEFQGAGGGGGSAGTLAVIKNLSLSSDAECVIHVGGGGAYGSGSNGSNGGHTSIKCGNNAQEYKVSGGYGGKTGISGTESAPEPVGGLAGDIGEVNSNILQLGTIATVTYGEGYKKDTSSDIQNKINAKLNGSKNIGGSGGNSGTGAIGGCGGLKEDADNNCLNAGNVNATLAEYTSPMYSSLITGDYAKAGAGGGGGGWNRNSSPKQGVGSAGQPGYLFLWWDQTKE